MVCGNDCDDTDDQVNPGEVELCYDLDNNCNGLTDETCGCAPLSTTTCSTGLPGICVTGTTTCYADGSGYGPCQIQIAPGTFAEVCTDGLDNDCDGFWDEDCVCVFGSTTGCNTTLVGICESGEKACLPSELGYGACVPFYLPGELVETCNGIDDDCDGFVDEGVCLVIGPNPDFVQVVADCSVLGAGWHPVWWSAFFLNPTNEYNANNGELVTIDVDSGLCAYQWPFVVFNCTNDVSWGNAAMATVSAIPAAYFVNYDAAGRGYVNFTDVSKDECVPLP